MNAHRQPPASIKTEPSDGPVATASAEMPPHIATAGARASAGVAASSSPSEAGMRKAAPTAWTTRPPISSHTAGANAHIADPIVKITSPRTNHRRRPDRSAIRPAPSSNAPNTTL